MPIQALRTGAARIGGGDLSQRISIKSGDELEALADQFNDMAGRLQDSYADLEKKVEVRTHELSEALEQQTATSEVLKVISSSHGNLEPVFNAMLANATRICEATYGNLFLRDGTKFRAVAVHSKENYADFWRQNSEIDSARSSANSARAGCRQDRTGHPYALICGPTSPISRRTRASSSLSMWPAHGPLMAVPMLKEGEIIGAINVYRQEVRPVQQQADRADAEFCGAGGHRDRKHPPAQLSCARPLQQQTATADVLKVISRSTFDLQTSVAGVGRSSCPPLRSGPGDHRPGAGRGVYRARRPYGFSGPIQRAWSETCRSSRSAARRRDGHSLEGRLVHIPDVQEDPEYTFVEAQKFGDFRTILSVPMLREGAAIGVLALTRHEVQPFTDKQIELVTTFADQAAIAIENVRLFESVEARTRELGQSLEELRTAQDRLVQTEKLASLGQLTAGIAHEIKNPLNFVNNFSAVSVELIDELRQALSGANVERQVARAKSTRLRICCRAISTRSCSTANAPTQSSRTCCCIRGRAPASTGPSTSTPSSRRASISPITARAPRSRASTSPWTGLSIRQPVRSICFHRKSRAFC